MTGLRFIAALALACLTLIVTSGAEAATSPDRWHRRGDRGRAVRLSRQPGTMATGAARAPAGATPIRQAVRPGRFADAAPRCGSSAHPGLAGWRRRLKLSPDIAGAGHNRRSAYLTNELLSTGARSSIRAQWKALHSQRLQINLARRFELRGQ
jgi:hypothetical protein